jgi:hypothetical protein
LMSQPFLAVYHGFVEMDDAGRIYDQKGMLISRDPLPFPIRPPLLHLSVEGNEVDAKFSDMELKGLPLSSLQMSVGGKPRGATESDYQGKFGLYIDKTAATFSAVSVKLTKRDGAATTAKSN